MVVNIKYITLYNKIIFTCKQIVTRPTLRKLKEGIICVILYIVYFFKVPWGLITISFIKCLILNFKNFIQNMSQIVNNIWLT